MANEYFRSAFSGEQIEAAISSVVNGTIKKEAAEEATRAAEGFAKEAKQVADSFDWIPTKTVHVEGGVVVPDVAVQFVSGYASMTGPWVGSIKAGNSYLVHWNGNPYEVTAFKTTAGDTIMGNANILGIGNDTGEPFVFEVLTSTSCYVVSSSQSNKAVTVRIDALEKADYNKMPEGYMPEAIKYFVLKSSDRNSTKKFMITVDDTGTLRSTEVT